MPNSYLHRCLRLHGEVRSIHYRKSLRQDVGAIESEMEAVRSSGRLRYEDLEQILNPDVWDADDFGYWPSRDELERSLESRSWDFWNQPRNEDDLIAALLEVFRQIELVSVVLRFIVPQHFGIMSPPVENLLGIGPSENHVEKYKGCLASLREVRDGYGGLTTAAEADMALWVLQVGVLDGVLEAAGNKEECEALRREYERDTRLRAIRVRNLSKQLFEEMSRPQLAEALLDGAANDKQGRKRVDLAGQIAGIEFERFVGKLAGRRAGDSRTLMEMVHEVRDRRSDWPASWRSAVAIRNRAVHLGNPSVEDVRRLIVAMMDAKSQAEGDER